ncbi:MAG: 50S ribosomal protein L18 [Desulfobacterales bacterium]|nr:50S ribosomal protein L18 [Desulfobacterales bacterium]
MGTLNPKTQARLKRKKRIRKKLVGSADRPRLCVFRSAKHIYAQVIDDSAGKTLASASSTEKAVREKPESKNKLSNANTVGEIIGKRAMEKGVKQVVFDRNGFLYHGRIKAVSDGARKAGLKF